MLADEHSYKKKQLQMYSVEPAAEQQIVYHDLKNDCRALLQLIESAKEELT